MKLERQFLESLMSVALDEAQQGFQEGEVPVGAVLAYRGKIISRDHNRMEQRRDPTAHAEGLVIRRASSLIRNWRLLNCILCVTVEPCAMCTGAAKLARIPVIVYGAEDQRMGAMGSLYDISQDPRFGAVPRVISGIEGARCASLMQDFFKNRRSELRTATVGGTKVTLH